MGLKFGSMRTTGIKTPPQVLIKSPDNLDSVLVPFDPAMRFEEFKDHIEFAIKKVYEWGKNERN